LTALAGNPDWQARAGRLRRWTVGLVAIAIALIVAASEALQVAPYVITMVVENLLYAAVALGVLAYFGARGEPDYRRARALWFASLGVAVAVVPAMLVVQRVENKRETDKVAAIVRSMADGVKEADEQYARRIKAEMKASTGAVISAEAITDAAARKEARANLASILRIVDESLSLRARIPQEAVAKIHATAAPKRVKDAVIADLPSTAASDPLSVRLMKGTRSFFAKAGELIAHVDANEGKFEWREGRLEFTESAAGERHGVLRAELAVLESELRRLK
jgi:hypothetical protein